MRRSLLPLSCLVLCLGCSAEPPVLTLEITPGHETGAFSEEPAVTRMDVVGRGSGGEAVVSAAAPPGGSFDLGEVPIGVLLTFHVSGVDATETPRVGGRSLAVVVGGVTSETLPIFAQRLGGWSRPPGQLTHSHIGGQAVAVGERYLLLTGGEALAGEVPGEPAAAAYYDLLGLGGSTGNVLPRVAESLVIASTGSHALLIDHAGGSWLDLSTGTAYDVDPPAGLTFAEVAGGQAVQADDGTIYLAGATRPAEPSDAVLVLAPDGTVAAARLTSPRAGAAATWLEGMGLVIAGGSDEAAGLEVLAPGAGTATPRLYPPDPVQGAAATPQGGRSVLLLGGVDAAGDPAGLRVADVDCATECAAELLAPLPAEPLGGCQAFVASAAEIFLLCHDTSPAAANRTFVVDPTTAAATELPLREPRAGATAVAAPNGTLCLLGGRHLDDGSGAFTVEMLLPESP